MNCKIGTPRRVCCTMLLCLFLVYLLLMGINQVNFKSREDILKSSGQTNSPFSNNYSSLENIYNERKSFVNNYCRENEGLIPEQTFLNPTYKFYYYHLKSKNIFFHRCNIGKVGGGTWRANIAQLLANEGKGLAKMKQHSLNHYSNVHGAQTLNFVFVRNPISRLASAYYNKMFGNWSNPLKGKLDTWPTRKEILMKYRGLNEREAWADTKVVSEQEFATFIVDNHEFACKRDKPDYSLIDPHWRPQTALCPFCLNKYDVIGKMETFSQDENFILQALGKQASDIVHFFLYSSIL